MDSALKASSNYIENHSRSSSTHQNGRTEYHEYRSQAYSSSNGGGGGGGEFNLEKQVQHMMPPPSPSLSGLIERSNNARNFSSSSSSHHQQSSSSQQQFTSYKVQSNQYSSSGDRIMISNAGHTDDNERPSSRLKQNIDELDTLLSDLN